MKNAELVISCFVRVQCYEIKMMGMEYFLPLDEGDNPGKELQ